MFGLIMSKDNSERLIDKNITAILMGMGTEKVGKTIYILEKNTMIVKGTAKIESVIDLDKSLWEATKDIHKLNITFENVSEMYSKPKLWVFDNIIPYKDKMFYERRRGAISWVNNPVIYKKTLRGDVIYVL